MSDIDAMELIADMYDDMLYEGDIPPISTNTFGDKFIEVSKY